MLQKPIHLHGYPWEEAINMNELISIIVPVYNVAPYLNQCLDSIINQTYKNLEIILVNDGSTDKTKDICEQYAKKDSRIIVFHKQNEGVSKARNYAINIMKGNYCIFVDGDDWLSLDFVEELYDQYQADGVDMVFANHIIIDDTGRQRRCVYPYKKNQLFDRKSAIIDFLNNSVSTAGRLYKKSMIDKHLFPEGIKIAEDEITARDILLEVMSIGFNQHALYYRRERSGSASRKNFNENDIKALKVHEQTAEKILKSISQTEKYVSHFMVKKYAEVLLKLPPKSTKVTKNLLKKQYRTWYRREKWFSFESINANLRFLLLAISPRIYQKLKKILEYYVKR